MRCVFFVLCFRMVLLLDTRVPGGLFGAFFFCVGMGVFTGWTRSLALASSWQQAALPAAAVEKH